MFQTFSGNSRRPRNVNLSGRTPNRLSGEGNLLAGSQNAVAAAQQNRLARQQERDRARAASVVQKSWRRYAGVKAFKRSRRVIWDQAEAGQSPEAFDTETEAFSQFELLLQFLDPSEPTDLDRLHDLISRLRSIIQIGSILCIGGPWPAAYLRLQRICLRTLSRDPTQQAQDTLLEVIRFGLQQLPRGTTWDASRYYETLGSIALRSSLDIDLITAPLATPTDDPMSTYAAFAQGLLECPRLLPAIGGTANLARLVANIDCRSLGKAVAHRLSVMRPSDAWFISRSYYSQRLWLLTHVVYCYRHSMAINQIADYTSDHDFVFIVGTLLSSLVEDLVLEPAFTDLDGDFEYARRSKEDPVDPFVKEQILSLVNQPSVAGLLSLIRDDSRGSQRPSADTTASESRLLANYILTLLRLFPRRGDEIRMWLYLGSSGYGITSMPNDSVIRYFWNALIKTEVFSTVSRDSRAAIALLKSRTSIHEVGQQKDSRVNDVARNVQIDDEWRVMLIFIELYMFVLRIMDDEQFFGGGQSDQTFSTPSDQKNPLTLSEIGGLTLFLKNLGFAMYYNAADILDRPQIYDEEELASFFTISKTTPNETSQPSGATRTTTTHIAGVHGMTLDHVRGLVTGLMKAIYERDSRRPFLPKDHWLMTSRFNMTNFIDAVVQEEESRHEVEDEDDEHSDGEESIVDERETVVGTAHGQRTRRMEQLRRQRHKAARRHHLQTIAPRVEILSNLPFFIPFMTRVQIFRQFVLRDQIGRRSGVDPDMFGMMQSGKHHAKIRRDHEFEDAFEQFYSLGPALKEPIRITFEDKFGTQEAGIDGGGVTKEFLTSVTKQAFAPSDGIDMFTANEQQFLFPNPSAIEEKKELLRAAGIEEADSIWREQVADFLHQYEFLGRIIGKCLYEGILIDVNFAGFFLLKWALTGGAGSAPQETGYRANINDLRDFDEGLYQGLIKLKNYPGDVEDFSLNFTVTDTVPLPKSAPSQPDKVKSITRDLIPSGSSVAVTNSNRLVYISYMARHRLQTQPQAQTAAFLRGLSSMIQPSWLSMFNQSELQTLVGGAAAGISVADLRANTVYGGVYEIGDDGLEHPSVNLFWQVMEEFEQEDRRKVLKFVTSTPRAPLLGFGNLNPKFSIRDAGGDETRLPSTSTCVNLLKLPRYSKKKVLRMKLLQAVNAGAGFDLS